MISTRMKRASLAAAAAAGLIALAGCAGTSADETADGGAGADWPETLTYAIIPAESSSTIAQQQDKVIAALESELGLEVEIQEATSYASVIEALRAGQADIAGLGPFSYAVAVDSGVEITPLGAVVDAPDQEPGYVSYGIANPDSGIESIEDFAGKKVCFVDPTSTSGFLFPSAGLLEVGIDPEEGVEQVMVGSHDGSALSVADGTCDAGFAYDAMVDETLVESGQMEDGAVDVVWESEVIPGSPYVSNDALPQDLQDELARIFAEDLNVPALIEAGICDSAEDCPVPEEAEYGFIPVEDSLYDGIRAVCEVTKSESCVA
ncbi:phosphate/phosphite/phosphonate ABC transporter substrate-binding protein [Microbacterium karelineae]|uniref:phosphate/phosphite/phosphonate ABC transporter substrate-binding protein n=1 Tax=Microbacterium karelineae TaxID=2654283 RepID=UPI0012E9FF47|nr:phosphate/phosphite/phosphonate ABC transporter substrate-binding protein [Microbacterium karelineae]